MRAVRNAPPDVEIVDVDDPEGDGEPIRVAAAGICASDLLYLGYGSRQIAGHEFAGLLGDGTPVAVEPIFGCAGCPQCDQGNFNRGETAGPTALGMLSAGGMSEYFRAPRHALVPLPSGLDVKDAALVEPASVAWHGCHMGSVGPPMGVAVVGGGAIGILAGPQRSRWASRKWPSRYVIPTSSRRATASARSPPPATTTSCSKLGGVRARSTAPWSWPGLGAPLSIWACSVTSGGPTPRAFSKEVALRPSLGYCAHEGRREFAEAADMLAGRPELAQMLITSRFPIEDAQEAFRVARDRSKGVFRIVIEP